jgi:hypothetical protein
MKTLACVLISFLVSAPVEAQVVFHLPTVFQVSAHQCGPVNPESYVVTGVDPVTSNYLGRVFAYTKCATGGRSGGGAPVVYAGCVDSVWDATGKLVSYSVEWRSQGSSVPPAASCLAP